MIQSDSDDLTAMYRDGEIAHLYIEALNMRELLESVALSTHAEWPLEALREVVEEIKDYLESPSR